MLLKYDFILLQKRLLHSCNKHTDWILQTLCLTNEFLLENDQETIFHYLHG